MALGARESEKLFKMHPGVNGWFSEGSASVSNLVSKYFLTFKTGWFSVVLNSAKLGVFQVK